jgi:tRNA-modifying protein YgfZ
MGTSMDEVFGIEVAALEEERAFLDRSSWRKVRVTGADALTWLGDLLTADIAALEPGRGCRSLLLTPTGRIRADVQVARRQDDLVLLQAPEQPEHIGLALSTYVLSSDVSLEDRTNDLALFTVPGRAASLVGIHGATEPSIVGPGIDVLVAAGKPAWRFVEACIAAGLEEAGSDAYEVWRVRRGIARMGPDFDDRSLPAEAGLEATIASDKGCFLGQEAVARVRNLGHPPRLLRHLHGPGSITAGEAVFAGQNAVGEVTSATPDGEGSTIIVRVRWDAAAMPLTVAGGRSLDRALATS